MGVSLMDLRKAVGAAGKFFGRAVSLTGSYTNAERKRTREGAGMRRGVRDQHLDPATLRKLGAFAAERMRNGPEARAIVTRLADLLVQDGYEIKATTGDTEIDRVYEREWRDWSGSTRADNRRLSTHFQHCRQLIHDAMIDGGTIINPLADSSNQLIELARLDSFAQLKDKQDRMQGGVELGEYDQPVKFHVRAGRFGAGGSIQLPAGDTSDVARMFRCPHAMGVNQTFGEPGLQALIERLETLDSCVFNGALAYELAAMIPLVLESANPDALRGAMEAATDDATQPTQSFTNEPKEVEFEPGRIMYLPTGTKPFQIKPEHPHTMMDKFIWTMVALMGADLGLPLVLLSLDFSQVNFHGGKVALGMADIAMQKWREELEKSFARPSYKQVIANGIRAGRLPYTAEWWRHEVIWSPMPIMDPKAEYEAAYFAIEKNLSTYARETARLGTGDWAAIVKQRAEETKLQRELGVLPTTMPGAGDPNAANVSADPAADAAADSSQKQT